MAERDRTLTSIIESKGLELDQLSSTCDDSLFVALTRQISHYDQIGFVLGLSYTEIEHIKRDKDYEEGRIMAVLLKWRSKVGSCQATHLRLTQAFLIIDDRETAEFVLDRVVQQKVFETVSQSQTKIPFTPEKETSKYRNWDSLSNDEQEQIKVKLLEDNENVKSSFGCVVIDILNSFQSRNIDHRKVKIYLQFALSMQYDNIDLENSSDLVDIFSFLAKRCSWYNFELFEGIVNKFGMCSDLSLLLNYITKVLQPYLKRSIFEIPPMSLSSHYGDIRSQRLFLKLPDHDLSLSGSDVKLIQTKLAKRLQMSIASFELRSYRIGCIELEFALEIDTDDTQQMTLLNECTIWDTKRMAYVIVLDLLEILVDESSVRGILQKMLKQKDKTIEEYGQSFKQSFEGISKDQRIRPRSHSEHTSNHSSMIRTKSQSSSYVGFMSPTRTVSIDSDSAVYDYATVHSLMPNSTFRSSQAIKEESENAYSVIDDDLQDQSSSKRKIERILKLNDKNAHQQAKNWFIKQCNKKGAVTLLSKHVDGTFLCRESETIETLSNGGIHTHVIDVMVNGTVRHFRVCKFGGKYGLSQSVTFDSILDLILYYSKHSLQEFNPNIKETLAFPVNSETHYEIL